MRRPLLDILVCPHCHDENGLDLTVETEADGNVMEGTLACPGCNAETPIRGGIPRFVDAADDYCENFGFQWNEWKDLQIDRLSGHDLSETRFFADSRWSPDWLKGKLILDAGAGAGRFADVAAAHGARIVACDLSAAIDACRDVTAHHHGGVECLQASLLDLPFKEGVFDGVYCMGVIQHTPDPKRVMSTLPRLVKSGGRVAYNFYEEGMWRRLQVIKYALRLITPHLPTAWTLALSKVLVALFYPLTRALAPIPKIRILNHFIPIASVNDPKLTPEQRRAWTLLDTFDWYGARYELRQHHEEVRRLLEKSGLEATDSRTGLAWGRVATKGHVSER